jgi:hypothetical protein
MVMDLEEIKERILRMQLEQQGQDGPCDYEEKLTEEQLAKTRLDWRCAFDARQERLIENCRNYTANDPAGMPGHNLAVIVERMAAMLDAATEQGFRV